MPYQHEGRQTFVRNTGATATNRRGQWHELVQHLHDLGYVNQPHFKAWHRRRAEKKVPLREHLSHVYAGIALYLTEEDYALYPQLTQFSATDFDLQTEWVETHLSILVFRLAELTSFTFTVAASCFGSGCCLVEACLIFRDGLTLNAA